MIVNAEDIQKVSVTRKADMTQDASGNWSANDSTRESYLEMAIYPAREEITRRPVAAGGVAGGEIVSATHEGYPVQEIEVDSSEADSVATFDILTDEDAKDYEITAFYDWGIVEGERRQTVGLRELPATG